MYYRRKILLSLIQLVSGTVEKIPLQKLLLLFTQRQETPVFDFIPYKFGCYSFSSNADLTVMARKGMLVENETSFTKTDTIDYLKQLTPIDKELLWGIVNEYGKMNPDDLMYRTYVQYPYYATRSETAERLLSKKEYQIVRSHIIHSEKTILFTIGYEGISLEEYLNRLIKNDIKVLVDVRNNPLSMKYGFSKSQLQKYCASIGVQYVHLPEVGIKSEQRQELNEQSDYDKLFTVYRKKNLPKTVGAQKKIVQLLKQHQRVALTCFEANIHQCHRKHLADAITQLPEFAYVLKHI
jgi:uncharacterized protein (DUF488 family)